MLVEPWKMQSPALGPLQFLQFNNPIQHLLSNYYVLEYEDMPCKVRILDIYV